MIQSRMVLDYTPMVMFSGLTAEEAQKIENLILSKPNQNVDVSIDPELEVFRKDGQEIGVIEKDTYLVWLTATSTTDLDTTVQKAAQSISERFGMLEKIRQEIQQEIGIGV